MEVPNVPMRIGFAWGGYGNQELGMGFGVKRGPVMLDFADLLSEMESG